MSKVRKFMIGVAAIAVMAVAVIGSAEEVIVKLDEGCGKVIARVGNTVAVHIEGENKAHVFKGVNENVMFHVKGVRTSVNHLEPGDPVCVSELQHMETGSIVTVEHHEVEKTVQMAAPAAPAPKPARAAAPAPKRAAAPAALPHTGSLLPLAGFAGLMLLALSAGIALLRRF